MIETENDRSLLSDERAAPADRVEALQRLAIEGRNDLRALVEPLIYHEDDSLRQWALHYLVQVLDLAEFADLAQERLRLGMHGEPMLEASMAAYSLGWYALQHPAQRERICRALAEALRNASDVPTQRSCYEAILRAAGNKLATVNKPFDRECNVDWTVVQRAEGSSEPGPG